MRKDCRRKAGNDPGIEDARTMCLRATLDFTSESFARHYSTSIFVMPDVEGNFDFIFRGTENIFRSFIPY